MQRRNTIIRTILILFAWTLCIYKISSDFDHSYWLDDLIHKTLIGVASIISLTCIYLDYKRYKLHKTVSSFVSVAVTLLSTCGLFVIVDRLKEQDRTPTIFYASKFYSGLNSVSLDFRQNGTYKCGKSIFFGDSYYTRGRYTIKDSIIYLDKSNLYDIIKSDKLLLKAVHQKDTVKKQGLLGLLVSLSKPTKTSSLETYLFQIDNKGDTISSAVALRISQNILAVR